jgi:hypothetical protein
MAAETASAVKEKPEILLSTSDSFLSFGKNGDTSLIT